MDLSINYSLFLLLALRGSIQQESVQQELCLFKRAHERNESSPSPSTPISEKRRSIHQDEASWEILFYKRSLFAMIEFHLVNVVE